MKVTNKGNCRRSLFQICLLLTIALFSFYGCRAKVLEGRVIDNFGKPVADADVFIVGSGFRCKTDKDGHYKLDYVPGSFILKAEKHGYLAQEKSLNMTEKSYYPLDDFRLIKIPDSNFVNIAGPESYLELFEESLPISWKKAGPFGARCKSYRVPESLPFVGGKNFLAFSPYSKEGEPVLITPDKNGVLVSIPDYLFSKCMYGEIMPVAIESRKVGQSLMFSGDLPPGVYCFVNLERSIFTTIAKEKATCFRWLGEVPEPKEGWNNAKIKYVHASSLTLRMSPPDGEELAVLPIGTEVKIGGEKKDYCFIKTADEKMGWVAGKFLEDTKPEFAKYEKLGKEMYEKGFWYEALTAFERAGALQPDNTLIQLGLVAIYARLSRIESVKSLCHILSKKFTDENLKKSLEICAKEGLNRIDKLEDQKAIEKVAGLSYHPRTTPAGWVGLVSTGAEVKTNRTIGTVSIAFVFPENGQFPYKIDLTKEKQFPEVFYSSTGEELKTKKITDAFISCIPDTVIEVDVDLVKKIEQSPIPVVTQFKVSSQFEGQLDEKRKEKLIQKAKEVAQDLIAKQFSDFQIIIDKSHFLDLNHDKEIEALFEMKIELSEPRSYEIIGPVQTLYGFLMIQESDGAVILDGLSSLKVWLNAGDYLGTLDIDGDGYGEPMFLIRIGEGGDTLNILDYTSEGCKLLNYGYLGRGC